MSCTCEHVVQFYDTEAILIAQIGRAMCIALDEGSAVVCIATDAHRQLLERHMMDRGIDVPRRVRRARSCVSMPQQRCPSS